MANRIDIKYLKMNKLNYLLLILLTSISINGTGQNDNDPILKKQIGQMLIVGFRGTELSLGTMSKAILTGILREQLHFEGVIITDDLAMGSHDKKLFL